MSPADTPSSDAKDIMRSVRIAADADSTWIPQSLGKHKSHKYLKSNDVKNKMCSSICLYYIRQFIELVNVLGVIMDDLSFSTLTKP